ncbi:MAG TPA: hypothetical protein VFX76_12735 [Roseiflexaceae bacterium]|nr:hypothetical protein [Roseiflexaceae bacterium]
MFWGGLRGAISLALALSLPLTLPERELLRVMAFELASKLDEKIARNLDSQRELLREHPSLREEELDDARREGLRAERAMLVALLNDGVLSEEVYSELLSEVDQQLQGEPPAEALEPLARVMSDR